MNIPTRFTSRAPAMALALALSAAASVTLPTAAMAQNRPMSSPAAAAISSFDVQPVQRLRPGEVLSFGLRGTPGGSGTLSIEGGAGPVELNEVRPGVFEGSYTIRQNDRINERSRVTARLLHNGQAATATLSRSVLEGGPATAAASGTAIQDFKVNAPERLRPGEELNFALTGAPGGKARVAIPDLGTTVPLREVSRGVYEGSYVVRRQDRLRGTLKADAYLVSSGRESKQRYEQVLVADNNGNGNGNGNAYGKGNGKNVAACSNCATVESVDLVDVKNGDSNALGTIAGGVLGGVIGNQVGGGTGKDIARVIGAVGGAYAGNRVQNNMNKDRVHRVTVRLADGSRRNFDYAQDPQVAVGTRVKIEGDVLVRQ